MDGPRALRGFLLKKGSGCVCHCACCSSWSRRACEMCILAPDFYFSIIHGPHDSGQSMLLGKILISIAFYHSFRERKEWFLVPSSQYKGMSRCSSHITPLTFAKRGQLRATILVAIRSLALRACM
jgi:hypothetical protein